MIFTSVFCKKMHCPKSVNYEKLTYEEIRQVSIKPPGKPTKDPTQWLPPRSAIMKLVCLIQSQIDYLLTICKPEADLPDFIGNGGLRKTKEGDIMYDLGPDTRYADERELLTIPDEQMEKRLLESKILSRKGRKSRKKRDLSASPRKQGDKGAKRPPFTSTPRFDLCAIDIAIVH